MSTYPHPPRHLMNYAVMETDPVCVMPKSHVWHILCRNRLLTLVAVGDRVLQSNPVFLFQLCSFYFCVHRSAIGMNKDGWHGATFKLRCQLALVTSSISSSSLQISHVSHIYVLSVSANRKFKLLRQLSIWVSWQNRNCLIFSLSWNFVWKPVKSDQCPVGGDRSAAQVTCQETTNT